MKIQLIGDTHGDTTFNSYALKVASDNKADCSIQLGDNGYYPNLEAGRRWIRLCIGDSKNFNIDQFFIGGNHDLNKELEALDRKIIEFPWGEIEVAEVGPRFYYIPRSTVWKWDEVKFLSIGGAFSVNRGQMTEDELEHDLPPNSLWQEEEIITLDQVKKCRAHGRVDVVLSHDVTSHVTLDDMQLNLRKCWQSDMNRDMLSMVADTAKPKIWVHGHYHHFYQKTFERPFRTREGMDWYRTKVYGLASNHNPVRATMLLDTGVINGIDG